MKTQTKIQTKKSTAVSVVSIEGHPVPVYSSPSNTLGDPLSFSNLKQPTIKEIKRQLSECYWAGKEEVDHYARETDKYVRDNFSNARNTNLINFGWTVSRQNELVTFDRSGQCDLIAWEADKTKKQLDQAIAVIDKELRENAPENDYIGLEYTGGFNWAENLEAYKGGDYEIIGLYSVSVWRSDIGWLFDGFGNEVSGDELNGYEETYIAIDKAEKES